MDTGETKLPGFMPGSLVESQISFGLPSADADPDWANTDPDRGTTDTEIPETYRSTGRCPTWPTSTPTISMPRKPGPRRQSAATRRSARKGKITRSCSNTWHRPGIGSPRTWRLGARPPFFEVFNFAQTRSRRQSRLPYTRVWWEGLPYTPLYNDLAPCCVNPGSKKAGV